MGYGTFVAVPYQRHASFPKAFSLMSIRRCTISRSPVFCHLSTQFPQYARPLSSTFFSGAWCRFGGKIFYEETPVEKK